MVRMKKLEGLLSWTMVASFPFVVLKHLVKVGTLSGRKHLTDCLQSLLRGPSNPIAEPKLIDIREDPINESSKAANGQLTVNSLATRRLSFNSCNPQLS